MFHRSFTCLVFGPNVGVRICPFRFTQYRKKKFAQAKTFYKVDIRRTADSMETKIDLTSHIAL